MNNQNLLPADIRVVQFVEAMQALGIDLMDPAYRDELQGFVLSNILEIDNYMEDDDDDLHQEWVTLWDKGIQMGYSTEFLTKWKTELKKHVQTYYKENQVEVRREKRVINGIPLKVSTYKDCHGFARLITRFLATKDETDL